MSLDQYLARAAAVIEETRALHLDDSIEAAAQIIAKALNAHHPLLVCGNGGSASDAEHIVGELVGRFLKERRALNAIALSSNSAVLTAWSNDYDFETVYARQVSAHGRPEGVLLALSTSGNSPNILRALEEAKKIGMATIGLTGATGGKMAPYCDCLLRVPSTFTPEIQQVHLCLYHYLCGRIDDLTSFAH